MKKRVIVLAVLLTIITAIPISEEVNVEVTVKHQDKMPTRATMEQKKANKIMARAYARAGWGWDKREQKCIWLIFMKESKFDHLAKNSRGSSAYGIAQMLGEKSSDPSIQLLHAFRYIEHRYGTPCRAWAHHRKGWY
jgi:hypothetical protein